MILSKKLTKSEFRRRADKILMRLSLLVTPFWDDSEDKQRQRLARAAADPLYFCRTYLPHYFEHAPAPFHHGLIRMLESRDGDVVTPMAVAAPREFAKTTVCSFGYVLHQICMKKRHFILIGSDTEVSSTSSGGRTWSSWMTWRMTPTYGIRKSSAPSWTG
jgi:hypothetical protein